MLDIQQTQFLYISMKDFSPLNLEQRPKNAAPGLFLY